MKGLIFTLLLFSCIPLLKSQSKVSQEEINQLFRSLDEVHFFRYVKNKKEIATWKALQTEYLLKYGWLVFPSRSWIVERRTGKYPHDLLEPFDYYFISIDGEELFKGGLVYYLNQAAVFFRKRNLKLETGRENMIIAEKEVRKNSQYFKHEIEINGKNIVFAEGNLEAPQIERYVKKFVSVLNQELSIQHAKQRIVLITSQDGVVLLIAEEPVIEVFKHLPVSISNKVIEE
ncbi:MAG TPA: hypothetical protein VK168_06230 [Saprospiraceae bacterium]|nr:hypothetical protein [Saprospiraceae bacterium]